MMMMMMTMMVTSSSSSLSSLFFSSFRIQPSDFPGCGDGFKAESGSFVVRGFVSFKRNEWRFLLFHFGSTLF